MKIRSMSSYLGFSLCPLPRFVGLEVHLDYQLADDV